MSEEHKNCKYRFKGKSCENCPLNCKFKRLQEENKRLQMLSCSNCGEKYLSPDGAELYEKNVQLQQENEKIKKQYNCYACGNCKGKEDYINLEKHHKGLRKQFEKYYQQTLNDEIQINELMQEHERLKKENEGLKSLNDFNVQKIEVLQEENKELKEDINKRTHCISCQRELENCRLSITNAKYKQALEEIRNEIGDLKDINKLINLQKILDKIDEVLNDRD